MLENTEAKLRNLKSGKLSATQNVEGFLRVIKNNDKKINAFIHINENALEEAKAVDKKIRQKKAGKLAGLVFAVKSCISVKDMPVTCASKTLENYTGTFDADAVKKIREEDGIIIGMANMDEFACGSSGENSAFGPTDNPAAPGRIPGGSSSGSAAAVAAGMCDIALGTDTGGSVRNPASHCGIVGVKPSYGRVSRYGLVDMAMSLEGVGILSRDTFASALTLNTIAGESRNDSTTSEEKVTDYSAESKKGIKGLKIGLGTDFKKLCTDNEIYEVIENAAKKLGGTQKNLGLKHVDLAIQTYSPIVYVEFFSATRKFDGRRYGRKIEEACGEEVLRRITGGREISRAEHHGAYYRKALAVKRLIAEDFEKAFRQVDVIALPTTPVLPHKLGTKITDPRVMYAYDAFTIPANLAGVCASVMKAGEIKGIPVGIQFMAPAFKEDKLFRVMAEWEKICEK